MTVAFSPFSAGMIEDTLERFGTHDGLPSSAFPVCPLWAAQPVTTSTASVSAAARTTFCGAGAGCNPLRPVRAVVERHLRRPELRHLQDFLRRGGGGRRQQHQNDHRTMP